MEYVVTGLIFLILIFLFRSLIFNIFLSIKRKLNEKKHIKNKINDLLLEISTLCSNSIEYLNGIKISNESLSYENKVHGVDVLLDEVNDIQKRLQTEYLPKSKFLISYNDMKDLRDNIQSDVNKLNGIKSELHKIHSIKYHIKYDVIPYKESVVRRINNSIDDAKSMIFEINKSNPLKVWRGFDYKNFDRNIESIKNKMDIKERYMIKELESDNYRMAEQHSENLIVYINNILKYIQSVFDVSNKINNGKNLYSQHRNKLDDYYQNIISRIKSNSGLSQKYDINQLERIYSELLREINNTDNTDWVLVDDIINYFIGLSKDINGKHR